MKDSARLVFSVSRYDEQKCIGNAEDKTIAAMLGGHSYNIVS